VLILHIGLIWPRKPEAWADCIDMALKLPEALGVFLAVEALLAASGEPPLQLGVKLEGLNLTPLSTSPDLKGSRAGLSRVRPSAILFPEQREALLQLQQDA